MNRAQQESRQAVKPAPQAPAPAPAGPPPQEQPQGAPNEPQAPPENFKPDPGDEIQQFLFAPTNNPSQPVTAGLMASQIAPTPDARNRMIAMLPDLQLAANDPSAPPQTKMLLDLLNFHLSQTQ